MGPQLGPFAPCPMLNNPQPKGSPRARGPVPLGFSQGPPAPETGPAAKFLPAPQAKKVCGNIQLIANYESLPYPDLLC